jgi:hypothetical protein
MAKASKTSKKSAKTAPKEAEAPIEASEVNKMVIKEMPSGPDQKEAVVAPFFSSPPQEPTIVEVPDAPMPVITDAPVVERIYLEDAAHQMINGYKDQWKHGLKTRAQIMGINPNLHNEPSVWREVFIAWGGEGILKK